MIRYINCRGVASTESVDLQRKRINQFTGLSLSINEFIDTANKVEVEFDIGYLCFKDLFFIKEGNLTLTISKTEQLLLQENNRFAKSSLISGDFRRFLMLNYFNTLRKDGYYDEYLIEVFTAYKKKHEALSISLSDLQRAERSLLKSDKVKNLLAVRNVIAQVKNELERVYYDLITVSHIRKIPIQETQLLLIA